jgi:putative polymerase
VRESAAILSIVCDPPTASAGRVQYGQTIGQWLAPIVPLAAVLFNFALCFANTRLWGISPGTVISAEIVLIGAALGLVWNRTFTSYAILLLLAAYFYAVMVLRSEFDPKIVRDIFIPIAFFFLGFTLASPRSADRLVTILIFIALGAALIEWLAEDTYVRYFDARDYYIARGTWVEAAEDEYQTLQNFFNSTRYQNRTLLPFLGDHRVSGIFLEAVSVGNFGAIAFAWVLLRDRKRFWALTAKTVAIVTLIVLADARFGLYFCILTLLLYFAGPFIRPTMLFFAPFLVMAALVSSAGLVGKEAFSNDMMGRFLYAGHILSNIDASQVFGLQSSNIFTGMRFALDAVNDSAYTYLLVQFGIIGVVAIWALFIYSPVINNDAWRFKSVIAFYYILALAISAAVFTIKTAALLWFLYGTLNNQNRNVSSTIQTFSRPL